MKNCKKKLVVVCIDSLRLDYAANMESFFYLEGKGARKYDFKCVSFPTIPARQDIWEGAWSFLHKGWGPLNYQKDNLFSLLHKQGVFSLLLTDNHVIVSGRIGGNYQVGFSAWEFLRGCGTDSYSLPVKKNRTHYKVRDRLLWDTYLNNRIKVKRETTDDIFERAFTAYKEINQFDRALLWVDAYGIHEPWLIPPHKNRNVKPCHLFPQYSSKIYTQQVIELMKESYKYTVEYFDCVLLKFIKKIFQQRFNSDLSLIVFSDHGIYLGENDWIGNPKTAPIFPCVSYVPFWGLNFEPIKKMSSVSYGLPDLHYLIKSCFGIDDGYEIRSPVLTGRNSPECHYVSMEIDNFAVGIPRKTSDAKLLVYDKLSNKISTYNNGMPLHVNLRDRSYTLLHEYSESNFIRDFLSYGK